MYGESGQRPPVERPLGRHYPAEVSTNGPPTDPQAFAIRREIRDVLDDLLNGGPWSPAEFDRMVESLAAHRALAIRQILLWHRERRIVDEVAALDLLASIATDELEPLLTETANDPSCADSARAACALVLIGRDRGDSLVADDACSLVVRWQARHLAEEPALKAPLMHLYCSAPPEERKRWVAVQDAELIEPASRAAVLEMLLEVERVRDIRLQLLRSMARVLHPETRAALRRVGGHSDEERRFVSRALANSPAADRIPEGWRARIGFCDGTGCFPLRFDRALPGKRPRCALFAIDLSYGAREALALTGAEVERYDRRGPRTGPESAAGPESLVEIDIADALGLLILAERTSAQGGISLPPDHWRARRLLDPLADVRPRAPEALPGMIAPGAAERSADLLDRPGYQGWFFDSGDTELDLFRIEVLELGVQPGESPPPEIVARAARRLAMTDHPRRIAEMLTHNAMVHRAGGESDLAAVALTSAAIAVTGGFATLPLVLDMIRSSLHPGHYFFSPLSEVPDRHDLMCRLLDGSPPRRALVLEVDLAWTLSRAAEVWISRLPARERPHEDLLDRGVLRAAKVGAGWVIQVVRAAGAERAVEALRQREGELVALYRTALARAEVPAPASDRRLDRLVMLFTAASRDLVGKICLDECPVRCPLEPGADGTEAVEGDSFPAGEQARSRILNWPGVLMNDPEPGQLELLRPYIDAAGRGAPLRYGSCCSRNGASFRCAVCDEQRPLTARSRSAVRADPAAAVCRRCQRRYKHDDQFRARVNELRGPLERV